MKSYSVKPGSFKNLRIDKGQVSPPKSNEVQVEIKAIGLNFADVFCVLGLYSAAPKERFVPGLEYSGIILQVGESVSDFKPGDRIMGVTRFGAYTTNINIDQNYVIPLPDDWSFEEGSAYLVQALTAYYGLSNLGAIKTGKTILIHSAAGGVGIWANRIAKKLDCFTIGTVGGSHKLDLLAKEGYDHSIVRNPKTFKADLEKALGERGLDIIMESIGGSIFKAGFETLAPMGRAVVFGSAHYGERSDRPNYFKLGWKYLNRPKVDSQNMIAENKSVMAFNLIYLFEHDTLMHELLAELGTLDLGKPVVGHTFTFDQIPDALREFQGGKTMGKVVIRC